MNDLIAAFKHKFFQEWFPNWSPDIALRYLPIADDIRKTEGINTILDVGSGSLGITPYLKRNVTGIDTTFSGPTSDYLKQINGSAIDLPFKNNSFDVSICSDTLEHVPKKIGKRLLMNYYELQK